MKNSSIDKLGTPPSTFMKRLHPNIRRYVESCPPRIGYTFEHLFPDALFSSEQTDCDQLRTSLARDLLRRMLVIDPELRINVDQALEHKYINLWYDESEVNVVSPDLKINFEKFPYKKIFL